MSAVSLSVDTWERLTFSSFRMRYSKQSIVHRAHLAAQTCTACVVWCGVLWSGVVWFDVVWSGVVWCGT